MQEELIGKVRRLVFARGFLRLRDLQMEAVATAGNLYLPYWVCFRGTAEALKLDILDAVRRRPEGAKGSGIGPGLAAGSFIGKWPQLENERRRLKGLERST